jgi:hypothetical protein
MEVFMNALKSLTAILCCTLALGASRSGAAANYQDWWWNPSVIGAGVNVGQQGDIIAAAWYLFDASGHPTFLTFTGQLVGNQASGNLFRTDVSGGVTTTSVGSATFTFTSNTTAILAYNYDNHSGSLNLQRFSFAMPAMGGSYALVVRNVASGCLDPADNGTFYGMILGNMDGDANTLSLMMHGMQGMPGPSGAHTMGRMMNTGFGSCTFGANQSQAGSIFEGSGAWNCTGGTTGNWSMHDLKLTGDIMSARFTNQTTAGDTCHEEGTMTGVRMN